MTPHYSGPPRGLGAAVLPVGTYIEVTHGTPCHCHPVSSCCDTSSETPPLFVDQPELGKNYGLRLWHIVEPCEVRL